MKTRSAQVSPLIIAGMARSGTTMIQQLCNSHPQMRVTNEFGNYAFIGDLLPIYAVRTVARIHKINGKKRLLGPPGHLPSTFSEELRLRCGNHAANISTVAVHLFRLARRRPGRVMLSAMTEASREGPQTRVVGDKLPQYSLMLDRLVDQPELLRLMIYRDCRDVTSSFLRKVRTHWRRQRWTRYANTAEMIARRWVRAIEIMEVYSNRLFVVRYEELVFKPRTELRRLAEWLGVEPSGFDPGMVVDSSVGKYRHGLTVEELDAVLRVAGPTLERLEYSLE